MLVSLDNLREIFAAEKCRYTIHAQGQMALRHIRTIEIAEAILGEHADIIEQYPDDKYAPSCLVYGHTSQGRTLHVQINFQGVVITAYEPGLEKWHEDFKTRRA